MAMIKQILKTVGTFCLCAGSIAGGYYLLSRTGYDSQTPLYYAFGAAAVAVLVVLGITLRQNPESYQELIREFRYLLHYSVAAWVVAGAAATIVAGLFISLRHDQTHHLEHLDEAAKIYAEVVIACLGLHIFYRRAAPISDLDMLLLLVRKDLRRHNHRDSRLWIVYPALNIGHYRAINAQNSYRADDASVYALFSVALKSAVTDKTKYVNATAITYPSCLYESLYRRYDALAANGAEADAERVAGCVNEATDLAVAFGAKLIQIEPQLFPPQVIVIGDVIYSIMSYGIPLYRPASYDTTDVCRGGFEGGESGRVAQLLVYRREDDALAGVVEGHLTRLIQQMQAPPEKPSTSAPPTEAFQLGK